MSDSRPAAGANPWLRRSRPLIIAHRGHSLEVPENTTEAYRRAIELGAEMIEADVHISRDGRLVMMHDSTLDRTTDGHGPVSGATWSELAELDAGGWFGEDFAGLRIPTTEDTIELARDAGIWMCFEVKGGDPAEAEQIANALVRLLVARDALGFAAMSGYNHDVLALAKRHAPELVLAPERLPDDVPARPAHRHRPGPRARRADHPEPPPVPDGGARRRAPRGWHRGLVLAHDRGSGDRQQRRRGRRRRHGR